jgi:23S rRNA pseudouridine2604 synthase
MTAPVPEPVRLAKRVAELLSCSRREAELYIHGGWVSVDGKVVEEPEARVSTQTIVLSPDATLDPPEMVTILFHQPSAADVDANAGASSQITLHNHAADDDAGIRPLRRHLAKLAPTLPLEAHAIGLTVFTQDWRVLRKLVDDAKTVEQEYIVDVDGTLDAHGLKQLNHGLTYNGRALAPAKVSWQNETRLRFAVKGAKPGQIAHMCRCVGLGVKTMKRIRIGKVSMGKMPAGQWRYLPPEERF